MDSCHIFNFLFGTKKATTELSRCFSTIGEKTAKTSSNRSGGHTRVTEGQRCYTQAPPSPLKQLQMRIASFGPNSRKTDRKRSISCDVKCGTYRATLIESTDYDDDEQQLNELQETTTIIVNPSNELDNQIQPNCTSLNTEKENFESEVTDLHCISDAELPKEPSTKSIALQSDSIIKDNHNNHQVTKCKRLVMYDDCDSQQQDNQQQIIASAEVYNIVSVFGEARAKLRRVSLVSNDKQDRETVNERKHLDNDGEETEYEQFKQETCESLKDKRSVYVRSLVQSIESNGGFETEATNKFNKQIDYSITNVAGYSKPVSFVKPLPPKTPPKTNKAKCLNMQLSLNKSTKIEQLFQDERFLSRFFDELQPLDRCVAAQVCRLWRNILYANQNYWKDLVNVIDCTQLRREHLVECIINTLQTAKLKQQQQRTNELKEFTLRPVKGMKSSLKFDQPVNKQEHTEWSFPSQTCGSIASRQFEQETSYLFEHNIQSMNESKQCSANSLFDIDQDDVWRIQELCNRFTQRSGHNSKQQATENHGNYQSVNEHQNCMTSKSSSIPSQISSTLSSVSISSLLSPLSESSRIESIKEKLYTSLNDRGFDAICLFGATDDDIDDLVCKIPASAHKRIVVGRLNNCSLTNRGFELFISTFSQIQEIELSGCNEITNSLEFRTLSKLRRLIITDCINIADGIAQKLIQILYKLDELTIQAYHLTDAFLEYLSLNSDTTKLKRLELPNCKEITNQSLITIAKHFHQLEALSISGSTKISDEGIEILAERARQLKSLDLSWCSRITDASLECIACDLGDILTELIFDRNVNITDIGLGYLATMSKLTLLHIRWCPRISDIGLESVIGVKSLRYLSLAGIHQITARSLLCLVETDLLEVELTNCPAVNNELLLFLSAKMPKCNIIF